MYLLRPALLIYRWSLGTMGAPGSERGLSDDLLRSVEARVSSGSWHWLDKAPMDLEGDRPW